MVVKEDSLRVVVPFQITSIGTTTSLRGYNPRVDFDLAIIGGGLAGASLAAALAESRLRLALIERKAPAALDPEWDSRVYALTRSEEHTSELQSQSNLVCRLLLEKKKTRKQNVIT